jgi:hypothetical protein
MTDAHLGFKIICVTGGVLSLIYNYIGIHQRKEQLKLLNDISNNQYKITNDIKRS